MNHPTNKFRALLFLIYIFSYQEIQSQIPCERKVEKVVQGFQKECILLDSVFEYVAFDTYTKARNASLDPPPSTIIYIEDSIFIYNNLTAIYNFYNTPILPASVSRLKHLCLIYNEGPFIDSTYTNVLSLDSLTILFMGEITSGVTKIPKVLESSSLRSVTITSGISIKDNACLLKIIRFLSNRPQFLSVSIINDNKSIGAKMKRKIRKLSKVYIKSGKELLFFSE